MGSKHKQRPAPPAEAEAGPRNYRFALRAGWINPEVVLEGVVGDEAEARALLHRLLDQAIVGVEPERR